MSHETNFNLKDNGNLSNVFQTFENLWLNFSRPIHFKIRFPEGLSSHEASSAQTVRFDLQQIQNHITNQTRFYLESSFENVSRDQYQFEPRVRNSITG